MGNTNTIDDEFKKPVSPLTDNEINMIKECWNDIEKKEDLGMAIMIRLFTAHSEIKYKWIFAANLETEEEMLANSQIRYHSKKIMEVFSQIIYIVIHRESLDQLGLERLGRSHFHYGVKPTDFKLFEESLVFALKKCLPNKKMTPKMEKAWHRMFVTLIKHVLDGLDKEEKLEIETLTKNPQKS